MKLNGIKLTWLGHATFLIETPAGKKIIVDPWVQNNPMTPPSYKKFDHLDVMLCTHGHGDHIGDAVTLAKQHDPKVVGVYELCMWMAKKGAKQVMPMNKGGSQEVGDIYVTMVHADHSCGIEDEGQIIYGGEPCGFVIQFQNGIKIYHAGDTNVFGDMHIINELYHPDIVMLPIGDVYTMGPREAAYACKLLKAQTVIPMHFNTFPLLTGTTEELERRIKDLGIELCTMKPGETLS